MAVVAVVVAAAAGGQPGTAESPPADQQVLDHSLKSCTATLDEYTAGDVLDGLQNVHREVVCTQPEPVATQSAGGTDPTSLGRGNFVATIYGTCKATSDHGCAPPLQIQTWPACERSPADYTIEGNRMQPTETLTLRGVPARFYGSERLEVSTGDVTVVIFGDSRALLLVAARGLRTTRQSPHEVGVNAELPPPVAGSQDGTLGC